jgi:hypothetical protein
MFQASLLVNFALTLLYPPRRPRMHLAVIAKIKRMSDLGLSIAISEASIISTGVTVAAHWIMWRDE